MPAKSITGRETHPAQDVELITPSDSTVIEPTREIEVAVGGDLRVRTMAGRDITIPAAIVTDGWRKVLSVDMIYETGTTADGILVSR